MTGANQHTAAISRVPDTLSGRLKVEEDIAFLESRISAMEKHPRPNRIVLDTYRTMLNSRQSVLKWLLHGSDQETTRQHNSADVRNSGQSSR